MLVPLGIHSHADGAKAFDYFLRYLAYAEGVSNITEKIAKKLSSLANIVFFFVIKENQEEA